jgi:hypothetical protein
MQSKSKAMMKSLLPLSVLFRAMLVYVGLARQFAALLFEHGWGEPDTEALAASVDELRSVRDRQQKISKALQASTRAFDEAMEGIQRMRNVIATAVELYNLDARTRVELAPFRFKAFGRSVESRLAWVRQIRPVVKPLDKRLQKSLAGGSAVEMLKRAEATLIGLLAQRNKLTRKKPDETARVLAARADVERRMGRLRRIAGVAFVGDLAVRRKFQLEHKVKPEDGSANSDAQSKEETGT